MISLNAQTILRLSGLAIVVVLIQTSVVSRFEFLGTNADLTPLVVAAVGLMCGALAGSCFGFGLGIVADLVLGGTMGVSSLVFLSIGYGAGRVRDLRDPGGGVAGAGAPPGGGVGGAGRGRGCDSGLSGGFWSRELRSGN